MTRAAHCTREARRGVIEVERANRENMCFWRLLRALTHPLFALVRLITRVRLRKSMLSLVHHYIKQQLSNLKSPKMPSKLLVKKLSEFATLPTKGSKLAAGYDLHAAHDCVIKAKGKQMVKTDLQVSLPQGCYGRIAPRSGLAWKHSIDVGAGVIDEDYRGPVNVILFNFDEQDFEVKRGDRIAQLICEKIEQADIQEVSNLDETERGTNGFGSTGV